MKQTKLYLTVGWILAGISLVFMPYICVVGVMILSYMAWKNGANTHALILSAFFLASIGVVLEKILSTFFRVVLEVMTIMY